MIPKQKFKLGDSVSGIRNGNFVLGKITEVTQYESSSRLNTIYEYEIDGYHVFDEIELSHYPHSPEIMSAMLDEMSNL